MEEIILCNICGCELREEEDIYEVENEYFCRNCYDTHTFSCAGCEERFLYSNNYGDDTTCLCRDCYDEDYYHCHGCDCIIHREDTYWNNGEPYCYDCDSDYNGENYINEYSYKPSPKFYRCSDEKNVRYYGVELEIDEGGKDDDNAEILYNIANSGDDVMYIKYDGSLDEGMELVSHPCSLKYHKDCFHWKEVMQEAKNMYYRSHNTGTCGLLADFMYISAENSWEKPMNSRKKSSAGLCSSLKVTGMNCSDFQDAVSTHWEDGHQDTVMTKSRKTFWKKRRKVMQTGTNA